MTESFFHTVLADTCHGDDRASSPPAHGLLSAKPPVLRRRTVALIAVLGIAAVLYGSLAPFQIDPARTLNWSPAWRSPAPGDSVANIAIYVPVGIFLRLLFRRRGSSWLWECSLSLALASGISYFSEVVQSIIPARVCTSTDVALNTAGAALGICFAPLIQRWLRNLHATLYLRLREAPMSMAAAVVTLCLCTYALTPPDLYPSPGHMRQAWRQFTSPPAGLLWWPSLQAHDAAGISSSVSPMKTIDKLMTAGAYGLLSFVLLLSMREANRPLLAAIWHALTRSAALATVLELLQAFTISHVADPRDLITAWAFCGIGSAAGGLAVACHPQLHQRPSIVLRALVLIVGAALLVWSIASVQLAGPTSRRPGVSWLPMLDNFDRSWNSLLGSYITGLLQYSLAAALLVLWCRSRRQPPRPALVLALTTSCALLAGVIAIHRHQLFDTAQILLAAAGAIAAIRLDRAIFGKREPNPALRPTEAGDPSRSGRMNRPRLRRWAGIRGL